MASGSGRSTAGENEFLERRQWLVETVERVLQIGHVLRRDRAIAWHGKLAAEIEQAMLNARQGLADVTGQARHREHDADRGVRLVDSAVGLDARMAFLDARAIAEPRRTVVAGARVDLR